MPLSASTPYDEAFGRQIVLDYYNVSDSTYLEPNKKALREICSICKERGIKLILVTPPVTPEHYALFKKDRLELMYKFTDSLLSEYPDIHYLDLQQHSEFTDHADFANGFHLNELGANKLTRIVAECLDSIERSEHRIRPAGYSTSAEEKKRDSKLRR